ncbi:MAG: ABC transporter substrate-binding protein [Firmicutes bacterium]|nr:ABC transporter substrate-binding protein [Bacillota bacterium]
MKKVLALLLTALLVLGITACGGNGDEENEGGNADSLTIKVGASPAPHAEILEKAKEILAEDGVTLEITEFQDYVFPNEAVSNGELEANYFQHLPYLEQYNEENDTDLVSVAKIHYEPYGIYAGKTATLEELQDGAKVAVPNDATNEARALLLLEQEGLITLKEGVGIGATALDIVDNPKNLEIVELEAAFIPRSLQDVDIAVINGNYAIEAGLNASKDALATEAADSVGADTFANIICVKAGNEENEGVKKLIEVLTSEEIKTFINDKYEGAVVPVF